MVVGQFGYMLGKLFRDSRSLKRNVKPRIPCRLRGPLVTKTLQVMQGQNVYISNGDIVKRRQARRRQAEAYFRALPTPGGKYRHTAIGRIFPHPQVKGDGQDAHHFPDDLEISFHRGQLQHDDHGHGIREFRYNRKPYSRDLLTRGKEGRGKDSDCLKGKSGSVNEETTGGVGSLVSGGEPGRKNSFGVLKNESYSSNTLTDTGKAQEYDQTRGAGDENLKELMTESDSSTRNNPHDCTTLTVSDQSNHTSLSVLGSETLHKESRNTGADHGITLCRSKSPDIREESKKWTGHPFGDQTLLGSPKAIQGEFLGSSVDRDNTCQAKTPEGDPQNHRLEIIKTIGSAITSEKSAVAVSSHATETDDWPTGSSSHLLLLGDPCIRSQEDQLISSAKRKVQNNLQLFISEDMQDFPPSEHVIPNSDLAKTSLGSVSQGVTPGRDDVNVYDGSHSLFDQSE